MEQKPIIDEKKADSLKKLLDSGSQENINLAVQIVEHCDIEKSFPNILNVMASCPNNKFTMNTPFSGSMNFWNYVSSLIHNKLGLIPIGHSLDFILDLWERHNKIQIIKEDMVQRKKLILSYQGNELVASFKPNLNPKKNVKRK